MYRLVKINFGFRSEWIFIRSLSSLYSCYRFYIDRRSQLSSSPSNLSPPVRWWCPSWLLRHETAPCPLNADHLAQIVSADTQTYAKRSQASFVSIQDKRERVQEEVTNKKKKKRPTDFPHSDVSGAFIHCVTGRRPLVRLAPYSIPSIRKVDPIAGWP